MRETTRWAIFGTIILSLAVFCGTLVEDYLIGGEAHVIIHLLSWKHYIAALIGLVMGACSGLLYGLSVEKKINIERRLKTFMDSATDMFFILDAELCILEVNKVGKNTFSLERGSKGMNFLDLIPDLEQSGLHLNFFDIIQTGEPFVAYDAIPHSKYGEAYFDLKAFKLNDGIGIIATETTGRKLMERELLQKRKLAALGQMAAGLAHELNTPLANINLTTEYILELFTREVNFNDNLRVIEELNDIKKQTDFCGNIINQLLLFSREIDISCTRFKAKPFFSKIFSSPIIKSRIEEKNIEILLEIDDEVTILGDKALLNQCFYNLIINSIDALDVSQLNSIIRITLTMLDEDVEIRIIDNGVGITEENLSKVFDPFFTTKPVGKGTGLGLAITRGIIEKHKGKISIKSTYGEGTEVHVTLPQMIN